MACSFILKTLHEEKLNNSSISAFFATNENEKDKYISSFDLLKQRIKQKGGELHLILFLSGMFIVQYTYV